MRFVKPLAPAFLLLLAPWPDSSAVPPQYESPHIHPVDAVDDHQRQDYSSLTRLFSM